MQQALEYSKKTRVGSSESPQCSYNPKIAHCFPQTIQTTRIPGAQRLIEYVEEARCVDINIIDSKWFAEEHPFIHLIHSASTLLSTPQLKSQIANLLAKKRDLVLELLTVETQYDSLRSMLRDDVGNDAADAYCRANYGLGDLEGAFGELALAYMDLTFKPFILPGLDRVG